MLLIIGVLFLVPGTIAAVIDDRKKVKWAAWIAVYVGIILIFFGFGGPAAVPNAFDFE
jgi:heme A synthase|tara:strand:+ start:387 stop:560 length:174 start_codon:yes stop_codon:yes gene_type:complete